MLLLLVSAVFPTHSQAALIWDTSLGSALPIGNFSPFAYDGLQSVSLTNGFEFAFEGATYNSITVATSGFVWLGGSNGSQCCVLNDKATTIGDFANGPARIAPVWAALRPDLGGSIFFNEIDDGQGARSVLTFSDVPTDPGNLSTRITFQLQLYTNGVVVFSYMHFDSSSLGPNPATLIGLTPALGSPESVDFTNLPLTTSGSVYDFLPTGGAGFDFSGKSIVFLPAGNNGFNISSTLPTPEPATVIPAASAIFLFALFRARQKRITKY